MAGHVALMVEMRNDYRNLGGGPERKKLFRRLWSSWMKRKMCLRETEHESVNWIHQTQDRVQWRCE